MKCKECGKELSKRGNKAVIPCTVTNLKDLLGAINKGTAFTICCDCAQKKETSHHG
jgi:hypothetical protein